MDAASPYCAAPAKSYLLDEEEQYALIDMVRYGCVKVVSESLRDRLLLALAKAAVVALYGEGINPTLLEKALDAPSDFEADDRALGITLFALFTLPHPHTK